jgi:hypothetical protein
MRSIAISLLGLLIWVSAAAQTSTSAQTSPNATNAASAASNQVVVTVQAVLNKSVDAKKAKQGDKVEARLGASLKSSNGIEIPKGSKVTGHVSEVKAHSKQDHGSTLGIVFDEVILKNGESFPFPATLIAVAPPPPPPTVATTNLDSAPTGGAANAPSAPRAGANSAPSDNVGVVGANGRFGAEAADIQLTADSRGAIGLPGVTLQSQNSGQANGSVLTSNGQNVKLESGTKLMLQLQP